MFSVRRPCKEGARVKDEQALSYPNYAAPIHWHDDIELIAILSGEMQYNVNGEILLLRENEGVLVNARQIHFGFSDAQKECDFICILLHPLLLCVTTAYERDFVLPMLHNRNAAFVKLSAETRWQRKIYENIRSMYLAKDEKVAPLKVQRLFLDIWTQLCENIPSEGYPKMQSADLSILKKFSRNTSKKSLLRILLLRVRSAKASAVSCLRNT